MAQPVTARFGKFRVLLGNDATPTVYSAPCGFTSKALNLIKNLAEIEIPDCADPDAAVDLARDVQSKDWNISGEGLLAAGSVEAWLDAYDSSASVPVKVEIEFSSGTVTFVGHAHLSNFGMSAERAGRVTVSVEMQGDGALVKTSTIPGA